ncbi:hypothetical protein DFH29DRAFT_956979, partial [Suillus ampliporus]
LTAASASTLETIASSGISRLFWLRVSLYLAVQYEFRAARWASSPGRRRQDRPLPSCEGSLAWGDSSDSLPSEAGRLGLLVLVLDPDAHPFFRVTSLAPACALTFDGGPDPALVLAIVLRSLYGPSSFLESQKIFPPGFSFVVSAVSFRGRAGVSPSAPGIGGLRAISTSLYERACCPAEYAGDTARGCGSPGDETSEEMADSLLTRRGTTSFIVVSMVFSVVPLRARVSRSWYRGIRDSTGVPSEGQGRELNLLEVKKYVTDTRSKCFRIWHNEMNKTRKNNQMQVK